MRCPLDIPSLARAAWMAIDELLSLFKLLGFVAPATAVGSVRCSPSARQTARTP